MKCRDVCECIAIWRTVPEADVDVERLEFARNRVATAVEGATSLAPPQGEDAHGTEGAPSELSLAKLAHSTPRCSGTVKFFSSALNVGRRWKPAGRMNKSIVTRLCVCDMVP